MKNRKRESCTSGTVRDEDGNILIYSARPHDGGAAHTRAGVRKPSMGETAMGECVMQKRAPVLGGTPNKVTLLQKVPGAALERFYAATHFSALNGKLAPKTAAILLL
jgi:hypothetical protein